MKQLAIQAENISKQYRLGEVGTGTLTHDLNRFWSKIRGKEDPYLKIGDSNDRTVSGGSDYVWSLKDINFEIEQGDAVGIIGRNGAGKSTLLKLLSKVTKPTTGNFKVNGRIASLLEVGTGFNPEMTGRENIYMNGAILGMRRHEITRKFDEIVAFSGVEKYIDTPVKRYSSGMFVRLAFAVAAHLESEILIIDEVLAVGDAEFQKKCLGKMGDVSKGEGRTVLFVSHNLAAVKTLCNNGILLQNGGLNFAGNIDATLDSYLLNNADNENSSKLIFEVNDKKEAQILEVELKDAEGNNCTEYFTNQEIFIHITLNNNCKVEGARLNFSILDKYENLIFITRRDLDFKGVTTWIVKIPKDNLIANNYILGLALDIPKIKVLDFPDKKMTLSIVDIGQEEFKYGDTENGIFKIPVIWNM
ncbi:ATP-binding cassette domain-containing protein [Flavobacterium sp. F-380]|jgi:lipopolysaccharide transport system ATP-binding protein|uniref:ATP-binding cassette domain-containing protein n=1 Tax=Flavobacterium kayseriense TaxID=2764714 RepID=A0ABR7J7H1_9FLAO|nr:polysaccharide ABC transporter ATP-binding protein [Flavobacterium kayseriense]MBC5841489.1 ATP-binding cassette domain-containing protein [Flavobacterium kayseriense]MBC5848017.1 ATP-binding cassette domain-containing protein [Flavobacterium kayseriense]